MSEQTYRLSPSKLSEFRENPRAFWLAENCRLSRPRGIFPSLPGGMDRVLKKRADVCRAEGVMPRELRELEQRGVRLHPDQALVDKLRMWQRAPKWTDAETGCSMIYGLDDLLLLSDGSVAPIDWKTKDGLPDEDYGRKYYGLQLDCYTLALLEAAGLRAACSGVLAFYSPAIVESLDHLEVNVRFEVRTYWVETDHERARTAFRDCVRVLRGPMPEAGPTEAWDKYAQDYARLVRANEGRAAA